MNTIVLGLDGLDYDLVKKWQLHNLQQLQSHKITVPCNLLRGVPTSPEVWASFLIGHYVSDLEFDIGSTGKLLKFFMYLRKYFHFSFGVGKHLRNRTTHRTFPTLPLPTFVDETDISEINAPYYSYEPEVLNTFQQFGQGDLSLSRAIVHMFEIYKQRKAQLMKKLQEKLIDSRIIFAYMHFPDAIQHLCFEKKQPLIKEHYFDLDMFVLQVQEITANNIFMIVSDHGFNIEKGIHSQHGFYSCNAQLERPPTDITDFYHLFVNGGLSS